MRKLLASAVVLMSVLAQGVVGARPTSAAGADVQIVGDSITHLSAAQLRHDLEGTGHVRYVTHISGRNGTTFAENLPVIAAALGRGWDWVVELGTNDAVRANAGWETDLDAVVHALRGERCVVFVTVGEQLPRGAATGRSIDRALQAAVRSHPNMHLAGWGGLQYRDPTWLLPDRIHPTPRGAQELAALVHRALNRAC